MIFLWRRIGMSGMSGKSGKPGMSGKSGKPGMSGKSGSSYFTKMHFEDLPLARMMYVPLESELRSMRLSSPSVC